MPAVHCLHHTKPKPSSKWENQMWKRASLCLVSGLQGSQSPQMQEGQPAHRHRERAKGSFSRQPLQPLPCLPKRRGCLNLERRGGPNKRCTSSARPGLQHPCVAVQQLEVTDGTGASGQGITELPIPQAGACARMKGVGNGEGGEPLPKGLTGPATPSHSQIPGPLPVLFLRQEHHLSCSSWANCYTL